MTRWLPLTPLMLRVSAPSAALVRSTQPPVALTTTRGCSVACVAAQLVAHDDRRPPSVNPTSDDVVQRPAAVSDAASASWISSSASRSG